MAQRWKQAARPGAIYRPGRECLLVGVFHCGRQLNSVATQKMISVDYIFDPTVMPLVIFALSPASLGCYLSG